MVLAIVFAYLTLQAMWVLIGPSWSFSSLCCLAFAACFPGMVYYYALFPVSLLAFLSIVCLLLYIRRHYLLAGLVGALCAWSFAIGPLVGVVLLIAALIVDRGPGFWRVAVRSAGVAFAGFAVWLLVNQLWVGDWRAYSRSQSKYANGLHDPISTFVTSFTGGPAAPYPLQDPNSGYDYLIPKAQTAFIAALVIGLIVWTLRRRPVSRMEWVIVTYTAVFWLLPLVDGASLGRYRMEALLVPCAVLCTRLPRVLQVALVGTAAVLAVGLATLFTRYQIMLVRFTRDTGPMPPLTALVTAQSEEWDPAVERAILGTGRRGRSRRSSKPSSAPGRGRSATGSSIAPGWASSPDSGSSTAPRSS